MYTTDTSVQVYYDIIVYDSNIIIISSKFNAALSAELARVYALRRLANRVRATGHGRQFVRICSRNTRN